MALQTSDADMYTDDSTLTAKAKTVAELEQKLASHAHKVSDWCTENRMVAMQPKQKSCLLQPGKKERLSQKDKEH